MRGSINDALNDLGAVASEGAQALRAMIPNVVGEIKTVAEFISMARPMADRLGMGRPIQGDARWPPRRRRSRRRIQNDRRALRNGESLYQRNLGIQKPLGVTLLHRHQFRSGVSIGSHPRLTACHAEMLHRGNVAWRSPDLCDRSLPRDTYWTAVHKPRPTCRPPDPGTLVIDVECL
jgi:hypothetical protein